ncbi:hypothetical protein BJB45_18915 [Halomonas huangheensis]|uniref:Uncharacterized protein n=1 Tax=Halomonas huangheensis TaxID=1178482 RepID=W1NAR2_9GAMM|nr:hypothetical protein AR456_09145 [Halomonas huangheensis]ERL52652.1 hypothetical protein BJB45_18915 [Halomonas huangheensis]
MDSAALMAWPNSICEGFKFIAIFTSFYQKSACIWDILIMSEKGERSSQKVIGPLAEVQVYSALPPLLGLLQYAQG